MNKKIFRSICSSAITVFVCTALLFLFVLYNYFTNTQIERLKEQTDMVANGVTLSGLEYLNNISVDKYRITLIDSNGKVLYDSRTNAENMENHSNREEFVQAIKTGIGQSKRYSSTFTQEYLYYAQKMNDNTIIRLSIEQSSVFALLLKMIQPICIIMIITVIISVIIAQKLSKNIVEPLNNINLDKPLDNNDYEEISPLLRRINHQQKEILIKNTELDNKKNELDTIIDNMQEGIVILNKNDDVVIINQSAKNILKVENYKLYENFFNLCRIIPVYEIVSEAHENKKINRIITLNDRKYLFTANPIISNDIFSGIALIFFDVTERQNAEQLRREFTANVSHELKTPLHTIAGYSELIINGMVKESDKDKFMNVIFNETQRMSKLVEDIINLSRLDEGGKDMEKYHINILSTLKEVADNLNSTALDKQVEISVSGEDSFVYAVPQLVYSIAYNLCDNAIKYNKVGGKVFLTAKKLENSVELSVKDTGIGIPQSDKEHVFERFYRVDKSRSKQVGGSGLGLSIVKHSAKINNAKIELYSDEGKGTEIKVIFEK